MLIYKSKKDIHQLRNDSRRGTNTCSYESSYAGAPALSLCTNAGTHKVRLLHILDNRVMIGYLLQSDLVVASGTESQVRRSSSYGACSSVHSSPRIMVSLLSP